MRKKRKRGSEGEGEAARGKGRRSGMKVCGEQDGDKREEGRWSESDEEDKEDGNGNSGEWKQ